VPVWNRRNYELREGDLPLSADYGKLTEDLRRFYDVTDNVMLFVGAIHRDSRHAECPRGLLRFSVRTFAGHAEIA
jgi:hypothetical protein